MRNAGLAAGLTSWKDPRCTAAVLGVTGQTLVPKLDAVIAANHSPPDGPIVFPSHVSVNEDLWRTPSPLEIYVDFETVNDLDDDFSALPTKGGSP